MRRGIPRGEGRIYELGFHQAHPGRITGRNTLRVPLMQTQNVRP